jgi:aspartyl-tRNA(Asn)/glutamyl-tRNA(Gln) amidotransferase subunit C|tara:strand:+ start:652 stop:942 length:291 start_codon:yes stop_codon:yes gene_type:complete
MKIDNKLIQDIATLAKLKFDEKSAKEMISDMEKIIGFVDKLSEVDTSGVDPLIYLSEEENMLREDEIKNEVSQKDALQNAPEKDSDYFKIPTVLKK